MKIKCEYCNSTNDSSENNCHGCSAPLPVSKQMDGLVSKSPTSGYPTGTTIMAIASASMLTGSYPMGYILDQGLVQTYPDYFPEIGNYYDVVDEQRKYEEERQRKWQEEELKRRQIVAESRKHYPNGRNYSDPIIVPKIDTNISLELPKKKHFWERWFK